MFVDAEKYKKQLAEELGEVTKKLTSLGIHNPENPDDWIATPKGVDVGEADPNVGADRVEDWDERRAIVAQLETRFNNIRRALRKIADGVYGVCELYGEPIEKDRLDANPAARTCKAHIGEETNLPM